MVVVNVRTWAVGTSLTLFTVSVCVLLSAALQPPPHTRITHQKKQLLSGGRVSRSSSSRVTQLSGGRVSRSSSSSRVTTQLWGAGGGSGAIKPLLVVSSAASAPPRPVFDAGAPTNVSGLTGTATYLHCLVHSLGNSSVSWIRQRDLHILTVGRYTYTTDQRYEVIHSPGSRDWILKIKYVQIRDSGLYECQVSSKPLMTYTVRLSVYASPRAHIIGSPDMHVDIGSTINLTCVITHSSQPPAYVYWTHNDEPIKYDSPRGGITVLTERGNTTTSYLLIQAAGVTDTGNYSCSPSNTTSATIRVHVLNGETPAAMQTNTGDTTSPSSLLLLLTLTAALLHTFITLYGCHPYI